MLYQFPRQFLKNYRCSFTAASLLGLAVFCGLAAVANAQTTTPTTTETLPEPTASTSRPTDTPASTSQPVPAAETQTERGVALSTAQQVRLINLAANISNRLETTHDRLANITDRLETRANRSADSGANLSTVTEAITATRISLQSASTRLENIDVTVFETATAANPRQVWQETKRTYRATQADLQAARASLKKAITALKTRTVTPVN